MLRFRNTFALISFHFHRERRRGLRAPNHPPAVSELTFLRL